MKNLSAILILVLTVSMSALALKASEAENSVSLNIPPATNIDIDGNDEFDALTDGLLILRSMFGLTGDSLTSGAVANDALYNSSEEIESRIASLGVRIDVDNNGRIDALTDGLIILRYLFGLSGDTLTNGVLASDAERVTIEDIESHMERLSSLNQAPAFTSGTAFSADENQTSIGKVAVTDPEGDTLTFSVSGSDLSITSAGDLTFNYAPDYETKSSYTATVTASDGTNSVTQAIAVTVLDVNEAPAFTSGAAFSADENQTSIGKVAVTDPEGDTLTFSVSGSDLSITSAGDLTFNYAPDYETKSSYTATVTASDGTNSVTQAIAVTVLDVNEAPVFTSGGPFSADENQTAIGSSAATDPEGDTLTFSVSGSELSITSAGVLSFKSAPDYETKSSYTATVTVSDGVSSVTQGITITVLDVNEDVKAPVFISSPTFFTAENQLLIGTVVATDIDSDDSLIKYSVAGSEFIITPYEGVLSFSYEPDFEVKSSFSAIITATDGSNSSAQNITVTLTDILEVASDLTCAKSIEALLPPQAVCDNLFITDHTYIRNRTAGIEDFAFGDARGHKFGSGQFMELGDNDCLPQGDGDTDFSFSFWFKDAIDLANVKDVQIIGTRTQYNPGVKGFIVIAVYRPENKSVAFEIHHDDQTLPTGHGARIITSKPVPAGEWSHVVVNYGTDGTDARFSIYSNTVKEQDAINELAIGPFADGARLTIGYEDKGDDNPSFELADFRSFKRQITKGEVRQLYLEGAPNAGKPKSALVSIMQRLSDHIDNQNLMSEAELIADTTKISTLLPLFSADVSIIKQSLTLVNYYVTHKGPLFVNDTTREGFERRYGEVDAEILLARALFAIQQAMIDYQYTNTVLPMCNHILSGQEFKSSKNFPGPSVKPSDPATTYNVNVNAYNPQYWGLRVAFSKMPSRQPTGYYLPPGSIGEVVVPIEFVDRGYTILVGAHTSDHGNKERHRRLDRVNTRFDIIQQTTKIANPLGGGVYIEVPYKETLGLKEIQLRGVIKSPLYSLRSFDKTTAEEWLTQRGHPGPWADFVSDKFMMQVPTSWIYAFDEPEELMKKWDLAMDGVSEYMGILPKDRSRVVLYLQPDLHLAGTAFSIGYPQVNQTYDYTEEEVGNSNNWMLQDPTHNFIEYHELGHAQLITDFDGEREAIVNFLHVYVRNVKFGVDFDTAFAESLGENPAYTVDEAAINWMITPNFRNSRPMDKSNTPDDEFRYQRRGYAKYADIVRLYGWDAYTSFNRQDHIDHMNDVKVVDPNIDTAIDDRILRLSIAAGFDLTPLIHFWGIHPIDPTGLAYSMRMNDLERDIKLKELLAKYLSLIPANNQIFNEHFERLYPGRPEGGDSRYGLGWYNAWRDVWDESHAEEAKAAQQGLIDQYYGAPMFTSSPAFTVTKGSGTYIGQVIGQVTATDPQGETISYSISGRDASLISVDSGSGDLTFNSAETKSFYKAVITVTDGTNSTSQNITVRIVNLACDNFLITDDANIKSRTDGIETFAFGEGLGHKLSAGQFMEVVDKDCTQLGKDGESFALSFWFRDSLDLVAEDSIAREMQIIGNKYSQYEGFSITAKYAPEDEKISINAFSCAPECSPGYSEQSLPIDPGDWAHVIVNYNNDGDNANFIMYIDTLQQRELEPAWTNIYNPNLVIGNKYEWFSTFEIAEFRTFGRPLSEKEIDQLYLDGEADAASAGQLD